MLAFNKKILPAYSMAVASTKAEAQGGELWWELSNLSLSPSFSANEFSCHCYSGENDTAMKVILQCCSFKRLTSYSSCDGSNVSVRSKK